MSTTFNLIYVTTANKEEAQDIGRLLIKKRLVACVNIIPEMESIFQWDGDIVEAKESILIVKTIEEKNPEVLDAIRFAHSYDCPCIVTLPILNGNPDFLEWISASV